MICANSIYSLNINWYFSGLWKTVWLGLWQAVGAARALSPHASGWRRSSGDVFWTLTKFAMIRFDVCLAKRKKLFVIKSCWSTGLVCGLSWWSLSPHGRREWQGLDGELKHSNLSYFRTGGGFAIGGSYRGKWNTRWPLSFAKGGGVTARTCALAKWNPLTLWNVCGRESRGVPPPPAPQPPDPSRGSGMAQAESLGSWCEQERNCPCGRRKVHASSGLVMERYRSNTEQLMFKNCQKFQ